MLKFHRPTQVVQVYLQLFRRNSLLKCVTQLKIAKKNTRKSPIVQGSRSFKVINVDTIQKLITSACHDKQHVCAYLQLFPC